MKKNCSSLFQRGQILLIVILVIIVASTIGLSLASRSITSLRTSTEEAESQKALAAAEAGIERTLQGNIPVEVSDVTVLGPGGVKNSAYTTKVSEVRSAEFLVNGGNAILKDEGTDIWFVDHLENGDLKYSDYSATNPTSLNLYWGTSSDGSDGDCVNKIPAAIQAVIITRDPVSYAVKSYRYVYDSCAVTRQNNFAYDNLSIQKTIIGPDSVNVSFKYGTPTNTTGSLGYGIIPVGSPLPKNIVLMRVIPIYKNAVIGFSTSASLPRQGYVITSMGTSGDANRKLRVFKGWPQAYLPYLSYGLFVAN